MFCFRHAMGMLLAAAVGQAAANPPSNPYPSEVAKTWELKGIRLGAGIDDARALFENMRCRSLAAGVDECVADNVAFAGGQAKMILRFLDATLISISAEQISREQTETAGFGLEEKFGAPTRDWIERKDVGARRVEMESARRMIWLSDNFALMVLPFSQRNYDTGDYFSVVMLVDLKRHDREWMPRSEGKPAKATTDI